VTWRARFRARQRRRALRQLLPGFSDPGDTHEVLVLAIPVSKGLLVSNPLDTDPAFHKRAKVANVVAQEAYVQASQQIKERFEPIQWPDHMGNKFKEGWKGLAAY